MSTPHGERFGRYVFDTVVTQGGDGRVPTLLAASKDAQGLVHRSGLSPWSVYVAAELGNHFALLGDFKRIRIGRHDLTMKA